MLEDKLKIPYLLINNRQDLYRFCKAQDIPIYERIYKEYPPDSYRYHFVPRTFREQLLQKPGLENTKDMLLEELESLPDFLIKLEKCPGEKYRRIQQGKETEEIIMVNGRIFQYEDYQTGQLADQFQFDKKGNSTYCRFKKEFV